MHLMTMMDPAKHPIGNALSGTGVVLFILLAVFFIIGVPADTAPRTMLVLSIITSVLLLLVILAGFWLPVLGVAL